MKEKLKVVSDYIYNPSDVLGTGTWGTVYKAKKKDEESEKQYALKKMNKYKIQANEQSFLKYQSEVVALQKSSMIPQIIQIVDFFKSKSNYYIVTEYIPGSKDLFQYMLSNKNKFCEHEARIIWIDLLNGLKSMHSLGIYHRDLKLQNILYIPEIKKAKIIDFGMATCFPNPQGIVGSPLFMSPQVLMSAKYTNKCDIWSLGIIFYCMIYRLSPYKQSNTSTKAILLHMKTIKKTGIQFPVDIYISKPCKEVISACLQYDENDRMSIDSLLSLPFFNNPPQEEIANLKSYETEITFKT